MGRDISYKKVFQPEVHAAQQEIQAARSIANSRAS
jgi:hypothetical protein